MDRLIDSQFQTGADGEVIYRPNGVLGRGYRVPADQVPRVRQAARLLTLGAVAGISLVVIVPRLVDYFDALEPFRWPILLSGYAVLIGLVVWLGSRAVTGLEWVAPPPWPERLRQLQQSRPAWTFWLTLVLGVLLGLLALSVFFASGPSDQRTFDLAVGAVLLPIAAVLVWDGTRGIGARAGGGGGR